MANNQEVIKHIAKEAEHLVNIQELIKMTRRLCDLLRQETALLKSWKVKDLPVINQEKIALTEKLELQKQLIISKPEILATLSPSQKKELSSLQQILKEELQTNQWQLLKTNRVHKVVLDAIVKAITTTSPTGQGYTAKGNKNLYKSDNTAYAYNQTI